MNILAIGAHPDDIELGCGGTLALYHLIGHSTYSLILSNGEKSGSSKVRREESVRASKILGIKKVFFGNLPDTRIKNDVETISKIEDVINAIKPEIVYTHSDMELHQDHRNVALSTFSAARNVLVILSYEMPSSPTKFLPKLFISIDKTIDIKMRSLNEFYSQRNKDYLEPEAVRGLAKFRGYATKTRYAEAFEVVKIFRTNGPLL